MTETSWWPEAQELPASAHLRSVAEILSAPESPEERRALRREEAAAEERRAELRDAADSAAAAAFRARVNGTPPRDVLGEAAVEPFGRDREEAARRRAAIDVLRPLGLQDVITGFQSGCILDPHLGILEPEPDLAARAELDRRYESARAEREVAERNRAVDRFRQRMDARFRTRGLDRRTSSRSAHVSYR